MRVRVPYELAADAGGSAIGYQGETRKRLKPRWRRSNGISLTAGKWSVAGRSSTYCDRNSGEAVKHYAKAIELGCNDEKSLLEYGEGIGVCGPPQRCGAGAAESGSRGAGRPRGAFRIGDGDGARWVVRHPVFPSFTPWKQVNPDEAWRYFYNTGYAIYPLGRPGASAAVGG